MKFPSISVLARELRELNAHKSLADCDLEGCDVRLQVTGSGWSLHSGDSSYDTDHRGYWGASSVPGRGKRFDSCDVARELISQARESYAQDKE